MDASQGSSGGSLPRVWSSLQTAVFDAFSSGEGDLVVRARAGCGKTTTIVRAVTLLPSSTRILVCAFNKDIAAELNRKLGNRTDENGRVQSYGSHPNIHAKTLHGLGNGGVMRVWPGVRLDGRRGRRLVERGLPESSRKSLGGPLAGVLSACKSRLVTDVREIADMIRAEGIKSTNVSVDAMARAVRGALDAAWQERDGTIDFSDMLWVPWALELRVWNYDVVVVDEAQDMTPVQLALALQALRRGGRLMVVGDDKQCIYTWNGADAGFMERVARERGATELLLNHTYRCPKRVVALANAIVPDLTAMPDAPDGIVRAMPAAAADWREGDAVISRTNAPLVSGALGAIRAGIKARIAGRKDMGEGLLAWIDSLGGDDVRGLLANARDATDAALERCDPEDSAAIDAALDRLETLKVLCDGPPTIAAVRARLESLFAGDGPCLLFTSTHKAKGQEWGRVFLLSWTFRPERGEEEGNLWYVAVTRTKQELTLLTGDPVQSTLVAEAINGADKVGGAPADPTEAPAEAPAAPAKVKRARKKKTAAA